MLCPNQPRGCSCSQGGFPSAPAHPNLRCKGSHHAPQCWWLHQAGGASLGCRAELGAPPAHQACTDREIEVPITSHGWCRGTKAAEPQPGLLLRPQSSMQETAHKQHWT